MKVKEMIAKIQPHEEFMVSLYERWQDEREYEDFNEYIEAVRTKIPEIVSGKKRPFSFRFRCDDDIAVEVRLTAKGSSLALEYYSLRKKSPEVNGKP